MIIAYQDTAEGVYLASGGAADNSDTANNIKSIRFFRRFHPLKSILPDGKTGKDAF